MKSVQSTFGFFLELLRISAEYRYTVPRCKKSGVLHSANTHLNKGTSETFKKAEPLQYCRMRENVQGKH